VIGIIAPVWRPDLFRRTSPGRLAPVIALLLVPTVAAAGFVAPGKDQRPPGRADLHVPAPVPCDQPVQELDLAPDLQWTFADSTFGDGAVDSYACQPGWNETGPEHVYVLTATTDLILDARLAGNDPNDHDLVLLASCDSDDCLVQANTELAATLTAGVTVYLVVDGYDGAAGDYELTIIARPDGIPADVCAPDGAATPLPVIDLLPEAGSQEETISLDLYGQPDWVLGWDCAPYTARGGEQWFRLTVAAADTTTAEDAYGRHITLDLAVDTGVASLDLALWLFGGCGPDAPCLAFVDATGAGGSEELSWQNLVAEADTLYLAVDSIAPVSEEGDGAFDLQLTSTVPVRRTTFGGVRGLFR
jgi:hypothetical protein